MNKKGLTLIEMMISLTILGAIMMLSMSLMSLMMRTSQVTMDNYHNRSVGFENLYYIIKDIQSSDYTSIEDGGKTLNIEYHDGRTNVTYKLEDNILKIDGEELLRADSSESKFEYVDGDNRLILMEIKIIGDEIQDGRRETLIKTRVMTRGDLL